MALSPRAVAVCLGSLLCITTTLYFFAIPDELTSSGAGKGRVGHWGPVTAEFDWCEPNHLDSPFVAEPWNTWTSLLYSAMAVFAWRRHTHLEVDARLQALLHTINAIGLGSTAFHATLSYRMQLLDELPIYYLILVAVWSLYERGKEPVHGAWLPASLAVWACAMTAVLALTEQTSAVHQAFRGVLTLSFSGCFLYTFWACSTASAEHQARAGGDGLMVDLFGKGFVCIITAIVCWIIDNTMCSTLRNLPRGLPYPQLHAIGWHMGTASGLYFMFLALLVQRRGMRGETSVVRHVLGCVPFLDAGAGGRVGAAKDE